MKNVAFRVDSSFIIGIGHVMRCLTLAEKMRDELNVNVTFFCRIGEGNINKQVIQTGFELVEMRPPLSIEDTELKHGAWLGESQANDVEEFMKLKSQLNIPDFDLLVIDHYGIDHKWQCKVKSITGKILIIDDIGDREHTCDYLLDQTYNCPKEKYQSLVQGNSKLLLGTEFALLRSEFLRAGLGSHEENIDKRILVMFGGTDPDNLTGLSLRELVKLDGLGTIDVILNHSAKHLEEVKYYCDSHSFISLHISPSNIADIMSNSSLAIGAAGTTSWERCAVGLPAVVVIQADNQREIARELRKKGVMSFIEPSQIKSNLNLEVISWLRKVEVDLNIRELCMSVCDGNGSAKVVKEIGLNV